MYPFSKHEVKHMVPIPILANNGFMILPPDGEENGAVIFLRNPISNFDVY